MKWIALTYSLPSSVKSSVRVSVWRRLQRVGAVAPAGNLYLLPDINDCLETFQWLAQEVKHAGGQALITHCEQFSGMSEADIIELFCAVRQADYSSLEQEIEAINQQLEVVPDDEELARLIEQMTKIRRRLGELSQIDYFDCPQGQTVRTLLSNLEERLAGDLTQPDIAPVKRADYLGRVWVTRPQPHVDRLATIWLLQRFIEPGATVRFGTEAQAGEISFDMVDAEFGHVGNLCTFETVLRSFEVERDGLSLLAEIIHQIDLQDDRYRHAEAVGIDMVLRGWLTANLTDTELVERGLALFDGLLASCVERV